MQARKKFDISKTTTGQLYNYYTTSVILKALYQTYHTLDPKYWAVHCGLALALRWRRQDMLHLVCRLLLAHSQLLRVLLRIL